MVIRRAEFGDIPELLRLLEQVNEVHHLARPDLFRHASRKYTPEALSALLRDPEKPILCAAEGAGLLGYAFCALQTHKGEPNFYELRVLYLDDLCVDECARRKGVASALFAAVEALAREAGCYELTLNVWEGNEAAQAFYRSRNLRVQKTTLELIL
ncbi:MAG: N-acetyltransferase family protein [bacterium]